MLRCSSGCCVKPMQLDCGGKRNCRAPPSWPDCSPTGGGIRHAVWSERPQGAFIRCSSVASGMCAHAAAPFFAPIPG